MSRVMDMTMVMILLLKIRLCTGWFRDVGQDCKIGFDLWSLG